MTLIATVRKIDGWPAINIDTLPGTLLASVRVKAIKTGRIYHSEIFRPPVRDARACVMLSGFEVGEMVAIAYEAVRPEDLDAWLNDDHEVPLGDFLAGRVACLQEPACNTVTEPQETPSEPLTACDGTQEAPEDLPEAEGPEEADAGLRGGVMGCAVAELRTVLIETMRRQDRGDPGRHGGQGPGQEGKLRPVPEPRKEERHDVGGRMIRPSGKEGTINCWKVVR